MKIYGKYDEERIAKEEQVVKAISMDIDEFLGLCYQHFLNNIEELKKVFPYRVIKLSEIEVIPYGEIWAWGSDEEFQMTMDELYNFGMYLPIIVLEKGILHKGSDPDKYQVLDGLHRVEVLQTLLKDGKIADKIEAFIFPEECINVRSKMKRPDRRFKTEERSITILTPTAYKLRIPRLLHVPKNNLFTTLKLNNKLEIYNCAMHLGHEITPHLYKYYKTHGYPLKIVQENMIKIH